MNTETMNSLFTEELYQKFKQLEEKYLSFNTIVKENHNKSIDPASVYFECEAIRELADIIVIKQEIQILESELDDES